jgi:DNA-binding NarL/FixJ family response regulator
VQVSGEALMPAPRARFVFRVIACRTKPSYPLPSPHRDCTKEGKLPARKRLVDRDSTRLPSRRQLRVIELVAQGLKNKDIAKELRISEYVVRNYLEKIYDKIGVSNRVELALWYWARRQEGKPRRTGN